MAREISPEQLARIGKRLNAHTKKAQREARAKERDRRKQEAIEDAVEYLAPEVPASHWIERGFDDRYAKKMTGFLERVKRSTRRLKLGTCDAYDLRLDLPMSTRGWDFFSRTIRRYDDVLLPHWTELIGALKECPCEKLPGELDIKLIHLPSNVLNMLSRGLRGKNSFTTLKLDLNDMGRSGIDFAVDFIEGNPHLKEFYWKSNVIERARDADRLVQAIVGHPSLEEVSLLNAFRDHIDSNELLRVLFASEREFKKIAFESNGLTRGGGACISDFIALNPPLEELWLANGAVDPDSDEAMNGGNDLDDSDAISIAGALKRNTNLTRLRLYNNDDITDVGLDALLRALFDPTTLNSAADSNHEVWLQGLVEHYECGCNEFDARYNCPHRNEDRERNKSLKIYSLLSMRNEEGTNVLHLNSELDDDSLAIVPHVLACVHRHSECVRRGRDEDTELAQPLSIFYELLRHWKMPELYER